MLSEHPGTPRAGTGGADEPETRGELPALMDSGRALIAAVRAVGIELIAIQKELDDLGGGTVPGLADAADRLAVIQDEVRQQNEEIEKLLLELALSQNSELRRLLSWLPLAAIVTSPDGTIVEANASARAVMRLPEASLGRSIFAHVAREDQSCLRSALSRACRGDEIVHSSGALTARAGPAASSYLVLAREITAPPAAGDTAPAGRDFVQGVDARSEIDGVERDSIVVRWVILPDYAEVDVRPPHRQLDAITRLCGLETRANDLRAALGQLVTLCAQGMEEASEISVLVGDPLEPNITVSSSAVAQHLDGLQYIRADGPALEAYRSRRPVALDGEAVTNHVGFAGDLMATSVLSLLAVPMVANGVSLGVLTIYGKAEKSAATSAALRGAMPFVQAAQSLIRDHDFHQDMHRAQEQLSDALTSRATIDQAKGMIMLSMNLDADDAFLYLTRMSNTRRQKVRELAESMVNDRRNPAPER